MNIITVEMARKRLAKAFKDDPSFRQGYLDTVAMMIADTVPGYRIQKNKAKRDAVAEKIVRWLFG